MEALEILLGKISDVVWGWPLLALLFGTHIFLTIRLRFIQRFLGKAINLSLERRREGEGGISHFGERRPRSNHLQEAEHEAYGRTDGRTQGNQRDVAYSRPRVRQT